MSSKSISRKAAIVGVGDSNFAQLYRNTDPTRTVEEVAIPAFDEALKDAGLKKSQIDGLIISSRYESFMYRAGLKDIRYLAQINPARQSPLALFSAATAVHHGLADYVAIVHSLNFRSQSVKFGAARGESTGDLYDPIFGMASPGAFYALAFSRYLDQYGATEEQLGTIPMAVRKHASMNPKAIMQNKISLDDYMSARYIAKPLRLFDYCLVNDGACVLIVTTPERARDLPKPPVMLEGFTARTRIREEYASEDYWYGVCQEMYKDIFDPLGLGLRDVDALQVYDNFSVSILWVLEGFGIAPRGQGLQWAKGGAIELGGKLPVNTSGGMMSEAYLQGANQHVEMVRQLRDEAGQRQIKDVNRILYAGLSVVPGATLLARDDR